MELESHHLCLHQGELRSNKDNSNLVKYIKLPLGIIPGSIKVASVKLANTKNVMTP